MKRLLLSLCLILTAFPAAARDVGEVSTVFKLIGPNHKIKIEGFEDPKISGVTCFVSRPVTGGVGGALGLVEDRSEAAISCVQTGPISFLEAIPADEDGEEIFNERRSILFKQLHVTRFWDQESRTLVYLTWSDRVFEGSPQNGVSAVTLQPWGDQPAGAPKLEK